MNGKRFSRREREKRLNRRLMIAFALVLFLGAFLQITMMARLTGQSKQIAQVEEEITQRKAMIGNYEFNLEKYHEHERIKRLAKDLGMRMPEGEQLRVVNLPALADGTSAQSADNSGAEEVMD